VARKKALPLRLEDTKVAQRKSPEKSIVLYFLHKLFFIYVKNKLDLMMITKDINSNFDAD
jgi:hypothetical protein